MKINNVLKKPIITEKSSQLLKDSVYVFEVDRRANKHQVKSAVESIFAVEVAEVKTFIRKGKIKRVGRKMQTKKMPDRKIAYIKVSKGNIDLFPKV
ncbi:MAG: 50S ribosomal protein L23 [Patescibacteria group bacterium]|nr:MAG: 50S ribosomal protein L23 [Patescibacteria group bacterium]